MQAQISVIDDDQGVREALRRLLESAGFSVSIFCSAEEFLDLAGHKATSCLIIDMRMPGMTGLALYHHLQAEGCRIPAILITACPATGEQQEAVAGGMAAYLGKPFSDRVLLNAVCNALEGNGSATVQREF
jgi:two-component system, LuxR family, response regulator FixJ